MKLIEQLARIHPELTENNAADIINRSLPLMHAIAPKDELETMLAVQMVGVVHHLSIKAMARAATPNQPHNVETQNYTNVNKISRTFIAQLEALNKHRGKGQQKMTVEHVHVNQGGQALIGNVD